MLPYRKTRCSPSFRKTAEEMSTQDLEALLVAMKAMRDEQTSSETDEAHGHAVTFVPGD